MILDSVKTIRDSFILVMAATVTLTPCLAAQDHVVSTADLHYSLVSAARLRQANVAKVQNFLSSEPAQRALKTARLDPEKIGKAVHRLTDQELARLASRADKTQRDFAAGALTNQQLTYIVIAIAAVVITLIIVKA